MNSRSRLRLIVACASCLIGAGLSGCVVAAAAAAAAGAVAYMKGELNATLEDDVSDVARATEKAIGEMRLHLITNKHDAISGEFVMRNAKDERITITLSRVSTNATKVQIRVGVLGDEELSRAILDTIKKYL